MNDLIRVLILPIFLSVAFGLRVNAQLPTAPIDKQVVVPVPASLPEWPHPSAFVAEPDSPTIRSGELEVTYGKNPLDGFLVRVNGRLMGVGCPPSKFGYVHGNEVHWLNCATGTMQKPNVALVGGQIEASYQCGDPDGGVWRVTQRLRPQRILGTLEVQTEITSRPGPVGGVLFPFSCCFPVWVRSKPAKDRGFSLVWSTWKMSLAAPKPM